jgi:hypothetical protein
LAGKRKSKDLLDSANRSFMGKLIQGKKLAGQMLFNRWFGTPCVRIVKVFAPPAILWNIAACIYAAS